MAEAIESVLAQTIDDWELLLIDDGSSDSSGHIARGYAERFPDRIHVLAHPDRANRGIAASRNLGMAAALGRYLAFLDADDVYDPERLACHVRAFEQDPSLDVVLSAELYWHSWQPTADRLPEHFDRIIGPAVDPCRRIAPPALIVGTLITRGAPLPSPGSFSLRASAVRSVGGAPVEFRHHYEDQVLLCKLLLSGPALVLPDCLLRYRQHAASITSGNAPLERVPGSAANRARLQFLQWLRNYVQVLGLRLPELEAWIDAEAEALARPWASSGTVRRIVDIRAFAIACVPRSWLMTLAATRQRLRHRRTRRKLMRYIDSRPRTVRDYWNERIDDTKLSDHPRGSAGYYAALDAYRLEKCDYLIRLLDWQAWAGRDVLEIGCGAGLDLVRFARAGARVTGVDFAPAALDLTRGYCEVAGVEASLIEADAAQLPFADATFDLVYCMGVLPFAADPAGIVAQAHRVLRPGGSAIFMVYNRRSWMRLASRVARLDPGHTDAPGFRLYHRDGFAELLAPFAEIVITAEKPALAIGNRPGITGRIFDIGWHLLARCGKGM